MKKMFAALAGIFVPLDVPDGGALRNFEGALSARDGLALEAVVDAGTERAATDFAAVRAQTTSRTHFGLERSASDEQA